MELFFSDNQRRDILKLLAAILHLGNVHFQGERRQTHSGGFVSVLIVVVSRGTRQHPEQPGNLSRRQVGTLPRRRLAAGGERFLFSTMVFSVIFLFILTPLCFPEGQENLAGLQFDQSLHHDHEGERDQTPQLQAGLRLQRCFGQGEEADWLP